jgi:predicted O-linked N-acetylglucosamine transferase (SPINDLY family)
MDYIIGDETIIPEKDFACYTEKCIAMPDTYMITDNQQTIAPRPTRSELGLPEDAFVLCTFNSPYKLDPTVFESWVTILKECDNTVLWLYVRHEETKKNLRAYAEKLGLDASRLIFADHETNKAKHLARLSLSNLFLDAFAIGAHTTCVDALWVGVPLVTCQGDTFVQRGASSILKAIDLPELITTNKKEYEDKIIQLVKNPDSYAALCQKLLQHQKTTPLFDTAGFARHLEKAYELIWQRYEDGLAPAPIKVPKI